MKSPLPALFAQTLALPAALVLNITLTGPARADISYLESSIGIEFEGCDFDKLINLRNGHVWECSEYGYTYHFGTLTVLQVNGTSKLCVGAVAEAMDEYPNGRCYNGKLYRWQ